MSHMLLKPLSVTCHFCLLLGLVRAPLPASAPMSSLITCSYTAILSHDSCPPCLLAVSSFTFFYFFLCVSAVFRFFSLGCLPVLRFIDLPGFRCWNCVLVFRLCTFLRIPTFLCSITFVLKNK